LPSVVAVVACAVAYVVGGANALLTVALLAVLESTLSFDNAVINARVLRQMSPSWQQRFLTWGIPIAVFGTRFLLPLVIVSLAAWLSPVEVVRLAIFDPARYGIYVAGAHAAIASFGSAFLFLVSFRYFFDENKKVHWIKFIEKRLARWGGIAPIEIALTISIVVVSALLDFHEMASVAVAGGIGIITFIAIEDLAGSLESGRGAAAGFALFVYLNVLDAAFSLDGVIGAFAVTSNLLAIVTGLGVGALFVRACTVVLVRARTLEKLRYLEHGAHWAIFGLGVAMLGSLFINVPQPFTGFIGLAFIFFAYLSSKRELRRR
jgi:hypothetical protein